MAPLSSSLRPLLGQCPDPEMALSHLERWLGAVSGPGAAAQQIMSLPATGLVFLKVLGSSSELGSCLIQNPELASLILDPSEIGRPLVKEKLVATGQRLLDSSSSYAHRLDRLRFLKQEALVRIAAADQAGVWGPRECWQALSILADALIHLAREAAWSDFRGGRDLPEECPLQIVGMGKLGGRELNYSSDIDLVFFVCDSCSDDILRQSVRFAEKLNRALSDRMGRGILFRVDMRLRPYGRSGELVVRQRSLESYMDRHAEAWEHMALIRSRVVAGSEEASLRWEAMREKVCFARPPGDWRIEEILHMRRRLEEKSSDRDLKRAPGGIRDVEFTAQILQLVHGAREPGLRTAGTLEALAELSRLELIPAQAEEDLASGCLFLRAVEHQVQVEAGRQTHETPESDGDRTKLASRMGFASLAEFDLALSLHRTRIRHWHEGLLGVQESHEAREEVLAQAGEQRAPLGAWVDSLPESERYYESLRENQSSLQRVTALLQEGPALAPWLRQSDAITEQVMSGEIMESPSPPAGPFDGPRLRTRWLRAAARTALGEEPAFAKEFGATCEALLASLLPEGMAVVAMGSFAEEQLNLGSDLDLVLVAPGEEGDERRAIHMVQRLASLKPEGSPVEVDLRLRPEGRQGPMAVTLPFLKNYACQRLEPWERMAASRSRLISGSEELFRGFLDSVVGPGLSSDEQKEALRIKGRVEKERAKKKQGWLDIKLGPGGLDDVIWTLHLLVLAHPEVQLVRRSLPGAAEGLAKAGVLPQEEADLLGRHASQLADIRRRLSLRGLHDSLLPLEEDKLLSLRISPSIVSQMQAVREVMEQRLGLSELS